MGATTLRIRRSVSALGAGVTGTSEGRSNSKPVFSMTSATLWPGWTLARQNRRRARSKSNKQRPVTRAIGPPGRQKKDVEAALAGAVKQFARAIGEERVRAAAKKRHERFARIMQIGALARQERGGCGNRRSRANSDMTRVTDQSANDVGKQLL